ncbi:MAG: hypothetical protein GQ570_01955 [Helicobacteraceae bacterium]|nr:hypothetical protein [Helicobacteraceae bacterium]
MSLNSILSDKFFKLYLFIALLAIWIIFTAFNSSKLASLHTELNTKSEKVSEFKKLEVSWSKKFRKEELLRVEKMLSVQGVTFEKKKRKKKITYTMKLNESQIDTIVGYLLNRNIEIKKFSIKKSGSYDAEFKFEVNGV